MKKIQKERIKFERMVVTKEEAMELFEYNKFKSYLIDTKIPNNSLTSVYKLGDFIDLCTGPHIVDTSVVKGFDITKHSAAYWLGDSKKEGLQRIYGISFPSKQ